MFRAVAILAALVSASAFSPAPVSTRTVLRMSTMEPTSMEEAVEAEPTEPVPPPPPGE